MHLPINLSVKGALLVGASPVPEVEDAVAEVSEGEFLAPEGSGAGAPEAGAASGGAVHLRWRTAGHYDSIRIERDGQVVAELPDTLCRFLTAGDVDGDGKLEMVAAAFKSGLWLLEPTGDVRHPGPRRSDPDRLTLRRVRPATDVRGQL